MPFAGHASVKLFAEVSHRFVGSLEARIDVKFAQSKLGPSKCNLEVYARDESFEELAFCQAGFSPSSRVARIKWLGRSEFRPVHRSVRGRRGVLRAFRPSEVLQLPGNVEERKRIKLPLHFFHLTVAEALLGVASAILLHFGASSVELQAMDDGSGKLVKLYSNLGFGSRPQGPGEILWMEAPLQNLLEALPTYWADDLLPEDFNGHAWLEQVKCKHFEVLRRREQRLNGEYCDTSTVLQQRLEEAEFRLPVMQLCRSGSEGAIQLKTPTSSRPRLGLMA